MQQGGDLGEPAPPPTPTSRGTRIALCAMSVISGVLILGPTDGHLTWPWTLAICAAVVATAVLINHLLARP